MTLTPRQVEVLEDVALGFCDKEIADRLSISVETVDFHLREIFVRLGAKNRAHAVAIHILQQAGAL